MDRLVGVVGRVIVEFQVNQVSQVNLVILESVVIVAGQVGLDYQDRVVSLGNLERQVNRGFQAGVDGLDTVVSQDGLVGAGGLVCLEFLVRVEFLGGVVNRGYLDFQDGRVIQAYLVSVVGQDGQVSWVRAERQDRVDSQVHLVGQVGLVTVGHLVRLVRAVLVDKVDTLESVDGRVGLGGVVYRDSLVQVANRVLQVNRVGVVGVVGRDYLVNLE